MSDTDSGHALVKSKLKTTACARLAGPLTALGRALTVDTIAPTSSLIATPAADTDPLVRVSMCFQPGGDLDSPVHVRVSKLSSDSLVQVRRKSSASTSKSILLAAGA